MAFLDERTRRELHRRLADMVHPVRLVFFTQELECATCRETGQLLRETAELSEKIQLEVYNFQLDREQVEAFGVDKIPATVVMGERDYGIRFYGIPSGYEFASLVEAIVAVSQRDSGLSPETREKLRRVNAPVHIQVLVTPT
jgi:glutaredoxin-like protein